MRSVRDGHCIHSVAAALQQIAHHSDVHEPHWSAVTLNSMHLMLEF